MHCSINKKSTQKSENLKKTQKDELYNSNIKYSYKNNHKIIPNNENIINLSNLGQNYSDNDQIGEPLMNKNDVDNYLNNLKSQKKINGNSIKTQGNGENKDNNNNGNFP